MRRLYKSACMCIFMYISKCYRIIEWLRLAGTSGPTGLTPKARPPRAGCPGPCPSSFWILPRRRLHSLSGHPVPVLSREVFSHIWTKSPVFQFVPISFHPLPSFFPPSPSKYVHRHNFHTDLQVNYRSMHLRILIYNLWIVLDMRLYTRSAYLPVLFCVCGKQFYVCPESLLSYYAAVHTRIHEQQINISKLNKCLLLIQIEMQKFKLTQLVMLGMYFCASNGQLIFWCW